MLQLVFLLSLVLLLASWVTAVALASFLCPSRLRLIQRSEKQAKASLLIEAENCFY